MSGKSFFGPIQDENPAIHGAFLVDETDTADPHVQQYLVTKLGDELFPFSGIRFDTLADAFADCADTFGLEPNDWQELAEPPSFHAVVQAATDEAIDKVIECGVLEEDAPDDEE